MVLQPIVEGKGEVSAARELIHRLMTESIRFDFRVADPIRQKSANLLTPHGISAAISLARQTDYLRAILIIFDGDVDLEREDGTYSCFCPRTDLPPLLEAARVAAAGTPCEIVVAYKEYESWLLAGFEGLVLSGRLHQNAVLPENWQEKRDAKSILRDLSVANSYIPAAHQTSFTNLFSIENAYRRSRSFRKLVKAFSNLHDATGAPIANWPPKDWAA